MVEVSNERRMELAISAAEVVNSIAFKAVVKHVITEQIEVLQQYSVGDLRATDAHATLRALNLIEASLKALAADKVVLEKQGKG